MSSNYEEWLAKLTQQGRDFLEWFGVKNYSQFLDLDLEDVKVFPLSIPDKEEVYNKLEKEKLQDWTETFYFVASPRKGKAPTLNKAVDGKLFGCYSDAEKFMKELEWEYGDYYKVFCAVATVPISEPVQCEVAVKINTFMKIESIRPFEEVMNENHSAAEV